MQIMAVARRPVACKYRARALRAANKLEKEVEVALFTFPITTYRNVSTDEMLFYFRPVPEDIL